MSDPVIAIFDPPMCCPGGLCGPTIDPALLAVNEAVLKLKSERGILVRRYLLQHHGQEFTRNEDVMTLLRAHGTSALPITTVGGKVVRQRSFPSYEDLLSYANGGDVDSAKEYRDGSESKA